MSIPEIDLSPWTNGGDEASRQAVVDAWAGAFEEVGFCLISNTGVPAEMELSLRAEMDAFFTWPLQDKMAFHRGPYGNSSGGYTPYGWEAVSKSMGDESGPSHPADSVESFAFPDPPDETQVFDGNAKKNPFGSSQPWYDRMEGLLKVLHIISARALGQDDELCFQRLYEASEPPAGGAHSRGNTNALRLAYYAPDSTGADVTGGAAEVQLSYGEHTDYQGFTILSADPSDWSRDGAGGLEVRLPSTGEWVPVRFGGSDKEQRASCRFVINSGDLIARWTNDRWHSTLHRVRSPQPGSEASKIVRKSIVFFSGPAADALVTCLPGCGDPKYEAIKSLEHLLMKLKRTQTE